MDLITDLLISQSSVTTGVVKYAYDQLKKLIENKFERISQAEEEYRNKPKEVLDTRLEIQRRELLERLSTLQTKAFLNIPDASLLQRVVPSLLEQILKVYEARSEQELNMTMITVKQVEGTLERYYAKIKDRAKIRTYAILVSILAFGVIAAAIYFSHEAGFTTNTMVTMLEIPLPILLWSAIGSFTAILYRFNKAGDSELQDPLRWLITRPLTGIVMGTVAYLIVKAGLLTVVSGDVLSSAGSLEFLWLLAFLAGFSDRFADGLLNSLVGRFGGESGMGLLGQEAIGSSSHLPNITELFENIKAHAKTKLFKEIQLPATGTNLKSDDETPKEEFKGEGEMVQHGSQKAHDGTAEGPEVEEKLGTGEVEELEKSTEDAINDATK